MSEGDECWLQWQALMSLLCHSIAYVQVWHTCWGALESYLEVQSW